MCGNRGRGAARRRSPRRAACVSGSHPPTLGAGEDDPHLLDVIRRIREQDGVLSSETFVYLKLNKQHYNWGTR